MGKPNAKYYRKRWPMGLHKMGALTPHFHCEEEILTEKVYTLRRCKQE